MRISATSKKARAIAFQEGVDASRRGECGSSHYEDTPRGWHWIHGWEMHQVDRQRDEMDRVVPTTAVDEVIMRGGCCDDQCVKWLIPKRIKMDSV